MSTDTQSTVPAGSTRTVRTRRGVASELALWVKRLGILTLAAVWVTIWGALAIASAGNEGLLKGIVLGTYTVFPVFAYLGWRLYRGVTSR